MVKSRQRDSQSKLIIHSKINWVRETVITFSTLIVWFYCIYVISFFVSALFNFQIPYTSLIKNAFKMTNIEIRIFLYLITGLFILFYVGLWCWKKYNQKKFGILQRRVYPKFSEKEDLMKLHLMSDEDYKSLFQTRIVVFERNPIRDLKEQMVKHESE